MAKKKNVLFIMTDQHRADHMGCAGNEVLKTPNLDRLASEGVKFTNAYCANPMCMPNRATIFTGCYPNVHGVRSNGINLTPKIETFVESMRKKGFVTSKIGKPHFQFWIPPFKRKDKSLEAIHVWMENPTKAKKQFPEIYYGFSEVETTLGHGDLCTGHYLDWLEERRPGSREEMRENLNINDFFGVLGRETDLSVADFPTTYCQERTIAFLERYSKGKYGNKPFFCCCSIPDPHHPVTPPGKYFNMYKLEDIDLPETYDHIKELYDHPFLGQYIKNPVFRGAMLRESTKEEVKKFIRLTYGSISLIDDAIGNIIAALEQFGLAEDTIVVYTSDHGDHMGDHGMLLKGPSPFDGVLRVPLIIKAPEVTTPAVTDSLASSIDLCKTISKLAGLRERHLHDYIQGVDLTPVLKDPEKSVREYCYVEEDEEVGPLIIRLRHLITKKYKITTYESMEDFGDIYNRQNDPKELHNLWDNKELRLKLLQKIHHATLKSISKIPERQASS
ncbi:MAG: sulfatase [Promethearchaeia archaeon]